MELTLSIVIGGLYAAGIYLILRRSIGKLILGLAILSHGTNLLVFTAAGLVRGRPPLIPAGAETATTPVADPLPQALILTAIVIGFGVLAFALVLILRVFQSVDSDDIDEIRTTDR